MSAMPLITHRMFVAAVAQEHRHEEQPREEIPSWPPATVATVEVLDPTERDQSAEWEEIPRRPYGRHEF